MLEWKSDTHLVVDGIDFALAPSDVVTAHAASEAGVLLVRKHRWMVERYVGLQSEVPAANVFELGIYEGGSTALLALLFRPRRLVAIDLKSTRAATLDRFIEANGLAETMHPYYRVDQGDRSRLEAIVAQEFGTEPLDLVIDDASHLLEPTKVSFNVLFPRLRPGGLFVIEDWSWAHRLEVLLTDAVRTNENTRDALTHFLESGDAPVASDDPLSRLVLELVLTAGCEQGIVDEMTSVRGGWVVVRRGDAPLDPDTFDISDCYGSVGTRVLPSRSTEL